MRKLALAFSLSSSTIALIACSTTTTHDHSGGAGSSAQTVGKTGGDVTTPDGVQLHIPANALAQDTAITVTVDSNAPAFSDGTPVGPAYVFGPPGTKFALPVLVTLPFDSSQLPQDAATGDVRIATADDGSSEYTVLAARTIDASHVQLATQHFSVYRAVVPPPVCGVITAGEPPQGPSYAQCAGEAGGGTNCYQTCTFECAPGYHAIGWGFPSCFDDPNLIFMDPIACAPDTIPSYETTEVGCHEGYHWVGQPKPVIPPDPALQWWSWTCELSSGAITASTGPTADGGWEFNTCEWGCPAGYQVTGAGTNFTDATGVGHSFADGITCPLFGTSAVSLSAHCKGKPPCECTISSSDCTGADAGADASADGGVAGDPFAPQCTATADCGADVYKADCDCATSSCACSKNGGPAHAIMHACGDPSSILAACGFPVPPSQMQDGGVDDGGVPDSAVDAGTPKDAGGGPPPQDAGCASNIFCNGICCPQGETCQQDAGNLFCAP